MKKLSNYIYFSSILLSFSSCYTIAFSSMGVLDNSASLRKVNNSEKNIVFIPMHHIGKQVFYSDVKIKIDSLRNVGYVFYYEGVKFSTLNDSLKNDTLAMKLRKIISIDMRAMRSNGGYIDTLNNTLMGVKVKAIAKHKLVNQPKQHIMFDTAVDRRVDVYLSNAVNAFEEKYGVIDLDDCDFNTPSAAKYKCKKYKGKNFKKFITQQYRNDFIVNEIINDTHLKIALVYGARHFEGILKTLQQHDSAWKSY